MQKHPRHFSSNSFATLLGLLDRELHATPIGRKIIVVSGDLIKQKIYEYILEKRNVATGFKVMDVASAMDFFSQHFAKPKKKSSLSSSLLTIDISNRLENAVREKRPDFEKVEKVFEDSGQAKLSFSERLSKVMTYFGYQNKRNIMLEGWLQILWKELEAKWKFPNALSFDKQPDFEMEVHFFAIPWIPPIWQSLIRKIGKHWPLQLYHHSPCQEFWVDGFDETDPLLAFYGKLDRMMFDFYSSDAFIHEEEYLRSERTSLLSHVKNDLLTLETTEELTVDKSILFQEAPTKMQEVEGLRKILFELIAEDSALSLNDMLVLAPDISEYASLIQFVFSDLKYEIDSLPVASESAYLQAFLHLLSLKDSRWTKRDLLRLLHFSGFTERVGLDPNDILQIRERISKVGVSWGFDRVHRNEMLSLDGQKREMIESSDSGSWKSGFDHLIAGLACPTNDCFINFSEGEVVGKFMEFVESLREDTRVLKKEKLTIDGWRRYLQCFADTYLFPTDCGSAFLSQSLLELDRLKDSIGKNPMRFPVIYEHLKRLFSKKSGRQKVGDKGIHFSSARVGNIPPKKVIAFLGMSEGIFPEGLKIDPFIPKSCQSFAHPPDEQRYTCLQMLLNSENHLVLSYCYLDPEDGQPASPGPFYKDLKAIIKEKGATPFSVRHEHYPFHSNYFKRDAFPRSHLKGELSAIKTRAKKHAVDVSTHSKAIPDIEHVNVGDLQKLLNHPVRFHAQKVLGIYLDEKSFISEQIDEEFELSAIDRALLLRGKIHTDQASLHLPLGVFKEIAEHDLQNREAELGKQLSSFGLKLEDLFSIRFSPHCKEIKFENSVLQLPSFLALHREKKVLVEGEVGLFCFDGPVCFGKDELSNKLKTWLAQILWQAVDIPQKTGCVCHYLGNCKGAELELDWEKDFSLLLDFYERALIEPPPIHPMLAKKILVGNEVIHNLSLNYPDPYLDWLKGQEVDGGWKTKLQEIFNPILKEYERV